MGIQEHPCSFYMSEIMFGGEGSPLIGQPDPFLGQGLQPKDSKAVACTEYKNEKKRGHFLLNRSLQGHAAANVEENMEKNSRNQVSGAGSQKSEQYPDPHSRQNLKELVGKRITLGKIHDMAHTKGHP